MWRIVISSDGDETSEFSEDNPNYTTTNEDNKSNDKLKIFTTKVCTQPLLFESGAQLISATTAAGHLSSSSIYPACFAPYLISTLSSEGSARFWKCQPTDDLDNFNWVEWKMMIHKSPNSNCINLPGKPVCISCAYNGRLAIAYKPMHQIDTTSSNANTTKNTITLFVAIYECESTGGSDWSLEDTIELKNIPLKVVTPAAQANLDLSAIFGPDVDAGPLATGSRRVSLAPGVPSLKSRVSVPSIATIECVRRRLSTPGAHHRASSTATHAAHTRKPIQLDWVTTEDGAHILTIAAGTTIALYASVSSEVSKGIRREDAQAAAQLAATNAQRNSSTIGAMTQRHSSSYKNSLKRKHAHQTMEDIRWMKLRSIELETADGALPSPTHISWVRDGLLVVGMENEMHVYSQWHSSSSSSQSSSRNRMRSSNDKTDSKSPAHHDQRLLTQSKLHKVMSMSNISTGRQTMLSTSFSTMTSQNASIPGSTPATTLPSASSIVNLTKISELKEEKRAHALRQYSDSSRTSTCTAASSSTSTSTTTTTTGSGDIAGDNDMLQCGLFEAARLANPVLPQYHPKQLLELLNFGRMQRVRAILAHLLRCISGSSLEEAGGEGVGAGAPRKASRKAEAVAGRQRLFSAPMVTVNNKDPTAHTNETQGGVTDYVEIACIPPLPLYALLAVDNDTVCLADNEDNSDLIHRDPSEEKVNEGDDEYNALFVVGDVNDETDDMFIVDGEETTDGLSKKQLKHCPTRFGTAESSHLAEHLTRIQLPGLSRLDQMYLLALADTVANTSLDSTNIPKPVSTSDGQQNSQVSETTGHIDESGLKYMLAARHFSYMQNSAPARLRQANKASLAPASFIWAFHSDSADDLLNVVPSYRRGTPLWSEMREFGVGWWLKSVATLRRLVEKMAKSAFQLKKDPMDAALYYMAMKKKNVIWGLFRSINDDRMTAFFRNDFTQPRWHQAALKNAFSLLGKQRFHHAAAFFLLGGAVDDAVEVCISKLNDLQLAMVILRLYDNDRNVPVPDRLKTLLKTECLGIKLGKNSESNSSFDQAYADSDPFIRSIAHWILKDYSSALNTLLDSTSGAERKTSDHHNSSSPSPSSAVTNDYESGSISGGSGAMGAGGSSGSSDYSVLSGSVFNFYNFLRTHPLLLRQSLADNSSTAKAVMLAGFSNKFDQNNAVDEKLDTDVSSIAASLKISPVERRLYFTTAHAHFRSGCPALALEVLSKLPDVALEDECDQSLDQSDDRMSVISTSSESHKETADALFSDPPASNQTGSGGGGIDDFDWSTPAFKVQEEELDLAFSDDGDSTTSTLEGEACAPDQALNDTIDSTATTATTATTTTTTEASRKAAQTSSHGAGDIMAHQLKFVACLKIMMEELSTLATGFEINAGQLRYHLYVWLEKAVEVLRLLCNYGVNAHADEDTDSTEPRVRTATLMSTYSDLPLHEAIIAEQNDFEEKLRMTSRRRRWLHLHQQLLRTLLSYSVLHGCGGGGLASVRMELILLLQELQQERTTRKQLTSPLPFPTTLPLLTSSIARTVIVNPIRHIENMTSDLLKSTAAMKSPPSLGDCPVVIEKMRTMAAGLSACIYQCLCDSEEFLSIGQTDARMEGFTTANVVYRDSYLMTGAVVKRRSSFNVHKTNQPNSSPSKWPGVSCLQSLLIRRQDPAQTPLFTLLLESSVAVYSALLNHALSTYDPNLLYRLVANTFVERMWPLLFGGGVRSLARETPQPPRKSVDSGKGVESPVGSVNKDSEMIKMRLKQHRKLLEASGRVNSSTATNNKASTSTDDKPTFREKFVAPKDSMLAYFLTKPVLMVSDTSTAQTDYDSSDSVCSTDDEDDDSFIGNPSALKEHLDPNSYSWCLMRYAIVKFVHQRLQSFLPQIGIELPDLAIRSPMVQASLTTLESWQRSLKARLELFASPPKDYIPGCYVEEGVTGKPAILKYKTLLEPSNTPFLSTHYSASPAKRLWSYLVLQQPIHAIFIRYIFKKSPKPGSIHYDSQDSVQMKTDPVRIVHKDQDVVSAFCINQVNRDHIALTTQKELIEMNIGNALRLPSWLEDTTEYDIEQINHPTQRPIDSGEFLVVETPSDRKASTNGFARSVSTVTGALSRSPSGGMDAGLAGSEVIGISLGCKRSISGIRRMSSHPYLPYYLTGSHDGSVRLWEWGHRECVSIPRSAGHYPKVSKVAFTAHGNKFGVGDSEGSVYLWQIGVGTSISKPFLHLHCHGKALNDFVFMGSSSVISTAGYSIENRNVAIWDTLLPPRSSLVQSFSCHPDGSSAVVYAAQHQILISAGKRGDICIFDVRQRQLRHSFQAHESNTAIRSMCLQPNESYFATGAIDGSMKIWNLGVHNLVHSFGNQHVKGSIFRSSLSSGPGQLELTKDGTLLSCGADGSMKIRQLRADNNIVQVY